MISLRYHSVKEIRKSMSLNTNIRLTRITKNANTQRAETRLRDAKGLLCKYEFGNKRTKERKMSLLDGRHKPGPFNRIPLNDFQSNLPRLARRKVEFGREEKF